MTITLSPEQARAADAVGDWITDRDKPYFYLAGAAGTGKTSIAKEISELQDGIVKFAAYTGKAARVLRAKGCPATTIHSLAYVPLGDIGEEIAELDAELHNINNPPTPEREEKIIRRLTQLREPKFVKHEPEKLAGVKLIILDECSMLDKELSEDLLSYKIPILVLGDPYQLPPIKGLGYFTNKQPDFLLTEIHRQAAQSPVIQLATYAREKRRLPIGERGTSKVMSRKNLLKEDALSVDQLICGSNKARAELIQEMRTFKGFSGTFPQKGEKLICLRNNKVFGILNGEMFQAMEDFDEDTNRIMLRTDEDIEVKLAIHPECFTKPDIVQAWSYNRRKLSNEFDFGWAITGHKSQGSEWNAVLVYADMFHWDKDLFAKWLYTAITRAADRVVVCL